MMRNLPELCSSALWKVELARDGLGYLVEVISTQILKVKMQQDFSSLLIIKCKRREIPWRNCLVFFLNYFLFNLWGFFCIHLLLFIFFSFFENIFLKYILNSFIFYFYFPEGIVKKFHTAKMRKCVLKKCQFLSCIWTGSPHEDYSQI